VIKLDGFAQGATELLDFKVKGDGFPLNCKCLLVAKLCFG